MGDMYKRAVPGASLKGIPAELYNALIDLLKDYRKRFSGSAQRPGDVKVKLDVDLQIQNVSGQDLAEFSVVALGDPVVAPAPTDTCFFGDLVYASAAPAPTLPFAILQRPTPGMQFQGISPAIAAGLTLAFVFVTDLNPPAQCNWAAAEAGNYANLIAQQPPTSAQILSLTEPPAWNDTVTYQPGAAVLDAGFCYTANAPAPEAWNGSDHYSVGDQVSHLGINYVCILASHDNAPPNATYWSVFNNTNKPPPNATYWTLGAVCWALLDLGNPAATGYYQVVSEFDDYLTCVPYSFTGAEGVFDPSGDNVNPDGLQPVYIAKPYWLQKTPWNIDDLIPENGALRRITYVGVGKRTNATALFPQGGVTIVSGGSGYTVGDTPQIDGGTTGTLGTQASLLVVAVDGGGAVTSATISTTESPAYLTAPFGTITTTGGTGTGLTVTVFFDNQPFWFEQITPNYIVGDLILAMPAATGLLDPDNNPILLADLNAAGRVWGRSGDTVINTWLSGDLINYTTNGLFDEMVTIDLNGAKNIDLSNVCGLAAGGSFGIDKRPHIEVMVKFVGWNRPTEEHPYANVFAISGQNLEGSYEEPLTIILNSNCELSSGYDEDWPSILFRWQPDPVSPTYGRWIIAASHGLYYQGGKDLHAPWMTGGFKVNLDVTRTVAAIFATRPFLDVFLTWLPSDGSWNPTQPFLVRLADDAPIPTAGQVPIADGSGGFIMGTPSSSPGNGDTTNAFGGF